MTQGKKLSKLQYMVITAVLAAIIVFLMFSGLGYIPTGFGFTITILMIPVAIGAILLGPGAGAILGTVFGLTSLATCFLGLDALGVALLAISPWKTVIVCLVPRILVGYLCGLIFKALNGKILKGRKTDLFILRHCKRQRGAAKHIVLLCGFMDLFWQRPGCYAIYRRLFQLFCPDWRTGRHQCDCGSRCLPHSGYSNCQSVEHGDETGVKNLILIYKTARAVFFRPYCFEYLNIN